MIIISQNSAKDELEIKTYANPRAGTGLAGGTLNAKDENENFDAEKFTKGFIYGLFGSKVTAEQGSKLGQAEAKQEVVKGDGWTMRDGKLTYLDQVKFELDDWLKAQTGIDDVITASLAWLKSEHPEMHNSKRAVKELIEYVLDRPSVVKSGKSENSVYLGKVDDNKMKDIVIDKGDKKIIHANRRKMTSEEKEAKRASEDALHSHTDTKPAGALTLGQDARLARFNDSIISQNAAKDETAIKTHANPRVGAGLAGGTLNAKDENGNFDAEKFAKGFIYGLFGSKVTAATLKKTNPKLYDQIVNIGKDKAGKESLSGKVDKIKMPDMGKFLQKLIADKNISDKTKTQMIEAAKGRYAQAIKNEQTKKTIEASAQKGRDMTPIGRENLNAEIVEYLTNNRQNVAIDVLSPKIAQKLGFRYANVKRTISSDAVRHTINRHGKDSDLVKKSGQKPVAYDDIAKWAQYADEADVQAITKDNIKQDVLISGKQLSEHYYVVVESIRKKANELAFKTMYFEKGSLKNSEAFKDAQTLLRGYEPDANSFAPLKG
ncbi:hypothetical protein [uncultured Campylobacter sp.]|mgnify:CR=1 FL=1|uniref:PBECR3 domain-containing polyvalent protein n=1 Tax=uncultured Campylobacter sp. TaxID=218934 RepID=UPI0026221116|nr:hypothetical protein [uncultured Campylobacter sp.]